MDYNKIKKNHASSQKHKSKKQKKHRKKTEDRPQSSDSDSGSAEMEWVEASTETQKEKRDEWMNEESFVSTLTRDEMMSGSSRERKRRAQLQKREKEEEIHRERELNPHWMNEGSGLPQEEASDLCLPSTSVGDGGYNYLKKAYLRIQEQAQREGRSMEEVAVERWGSLNKLVSMIDEAEAKMKQHSKTRYTSGRYKDDWNGTSTSKSFREPSPCDSPPTSKRSFRYEKPKDYDRNRKKICKFSSSDRKKNYAPYSSDKNNSPDESNSSPDTDKSGRRSISEKSSISRDMTRSYAAWKETSRDSSSDKYSKESLWKKSSKNSSADSELSWKKSLDSSSFENLMENPAWKKPGRDSLPDRHTSEPSWKKSSRESSSDRYSSEPSWKKPSKDSFHDRSRRSPPWKEPNRDSSPNRLSNEPSCKKSSRDSLDKYSSERSWKKPHRDASSDEYNNETSWKKSSEDLTSNSSFKKSSKNLSPDSPRDDSERKKGTHLPSGAISSDWHEVAESSGKSPSPDTLSRTQSKTIESTSMVVHTEDDLNRLAASFLRAELQGDKHLASELKTRFEEATEAFESGEKGFVSQSCGRTRERVLLTKMDSSGQQRPIQASREDAGFERRSGSKKTRNKYFDEGNKYSLKQMFEREKLTTTEDNLEMFLDVAAEAKESDDENETSGITRKASHKMSHGVQEEKDITKAMRQHQRRSGALEKCEYCLDSPNMKRHLIVTIREQVYLCIPNYQTLTEGHCVIAPKRHVSSFLSLDDDEWAEVEKLKYLLRSMYQKQRKSLLCLESSMNFERFPHAFLECIPVPEEEGHMAPMYFKKAILESEEEWAHNIKLVDLTKKGLRHSVPKNLPYFCILFDPSVHAGFAHVIEDEKCFPRNFGKEVIGGMLDIDYNHLYKNRREDPLKKSNEALLFTRALEEFTDGENLYSSP